MERKGVTITKTNPSLSYSSTTADIPLEYFTLRSRLDRMADKHADKVVYVFSMNNGLELTYADVRQTTYSLAAGLTSLGLTKGERIAYLLPNTHELVMFYFAASISGLVSVPLDADYGPDELDYMLNKTQPAAVVVYNCAEYHHLILTLFASLNTDRREEFTCARFPFLRNVIVVNDGKFDASFSAAWTYDQLLNHSPDFDHGRFPSVDSDDIFAILFTSGTTSRPKGIEVRYFSLLNSVNIQAKLCLWDENGESKQIVSCVTTLIYHVGAIFSIINSMMAFRYKLVFPSYKFELLDIMHAIQKCKCDSVFFLPKILANLIDHPRRHEFDLSSLEWIMCGGQHVTADLCQRVVRELGVKNIGIAYGMTEVNIISYDWLDLENWRSETFTASVGQPLPFVECKVVDAETGEVQPLNVEGELHLRGFTVTSGYWNDPDITRKLIDKNGWLNTGDIFTMNKDGTLFFKSRSKEIITVKGSGRLDVYPSIVESVLLKHENIVEAIVFGIAVNTYEQELCAWVKLRSNERKTQVEEVIKYCEERLIDYQVPRFVKFVDEFPANKMGKYLRNEMSRKYKLELGI